MADLSKGYCKNQTRNKIQINVWRFFHDEALLSMKNAWLPPIFVGYQRGFRSLHSTVTALLEATDNWAFNIDRGNVNAVVFLDLKKAFDTVDHDILLSKMNLYGIQRTALDWSQGTIRLAPFYFLY